jgi:hypothetical protein
MFTGIVEYVGTVRAVLRKDALVSTSTNTCTRSFAIHALQSRARV